MTRAQRFVFLVVLIGSFIGGLDQTIVVTAMPTVIGDLGGVDRYAWVFAAYLLLGTVTTPIFGRLADMYGRKPIYLGALVLFVSASALCAASRTMNELIAFRALQGIGSGGLLPIGMTIVGDLFDLRQRAKVQAFFAVLWGFAAVVGPAVGGLITQASSWRWVFLINLPFGIVTTILLVLTFREMVPRRPHVIDWFGTALFATATLSLLLGLNGVFPILTIPAALVIAAAFVIVERSAIEPLLDMPLLRKPLIGVGLLLNIVIGVLQFGILSYLPPFTQGVQGASPLEAGAVVSAMSLGWPIGGAFAAAMLIRLGPRGLVLAGSAVMVVGALLLATLGPSSPLPLEVFASGCMGLGFGIQVTSILVSAQSAVLWEQRGAATSLNSFSRNFGAAVGVSALGAVLTLGLGPRLHEIAPLLDPSGTRIAGVALDAARATLASSLHNVYVLMFGLTILNFVLAWRLPRTIAEVSASAAVGAMEAETS